MNTIPEIKLYGAPDCHKTEYYKQLLDETALPYSFLDVVNNDEFAKELIGLYNSGKLNFPTITIGNKKLRNPSKESLISWLNLLTPGRLDLVHDKENNRFTLEINGGLAVVEYAVHNGKMYLNHSEVPTQLRGQGIGKELVNKTFEKLTAEGYRAVAVCPFIKAVARRSSKWNTVIQ